MVMLPDGEDATMSAGVCADAIGDDDPAESATFADVMAVVIAATGNAGADGGGRSTN